MDVLARLTHWEDLIKEWAVRYLFAFINVYLKNHDNQLIDEIFHS